MIRRIAFVLALALLLPLQLTWAQQRATPVAGDTRLVTFEYDENQTYLVLTRPKSMTQIQLRAGEKVVTLGAGDPVNFSMLVTADRSNVLIRPKYPDLTTSVTLITTERSYPMMLRSTTEDGKWYQRVTWNFPDMVVDEMAAGQAPAPAVAVKGSPRPEPVTLSESTRTLGSAPGLAIDQLHFGYQIDGNAAFRPVQAFDDGTHTYLRMPDALEDLPAVFTISADGEAQVVNYAFDKKHIVIPGTAKTVLLKLGKSEVKVTKGGKRSFFNFGGEGG